MRTCERTRLSDQAKPEDFDAVLSPGGVLTPDSLRMQPKAVAFAKAFFDAGKPVAAIRHRGQPRLAVGR